MKVLEEDNRKCFDERNGNNERDTDKKKILLMKDRDNEIVKEVTPARSSQHVLCSCCKVLLQFS